MTYFMLSNKRWVELNFHYFYSSLHYSWFIELQFNQYKLLLFLWLIIRQVLFFEVFAIIFALLIVDLFVFIDWVNVHFSWNFSPGMIENCIWTVSKLDKRICFQCRFVEVRGEGSIWVFRIVRFNWLILLI